MCDAATIQQRFHTHYSTENDERAGPSIDVETHHRDSAKQVNKSIKDMRSSIVSHDSVQTTSQDHVKG